MFSKKLKAIFSFVLVLSLVMPEIGKVFAGEDVYYLENEIKDTEAKYKVVHGDLQRMDEFLKKYPQMTDSLATAHKELDDLEQRMKSLLQKNLIKSTIKLGLETYSKVNLVLGFAKQSITLIVLACTCEFASDQMQNSFSSSYSKTVKGLSDEATKLAPEIDEVQKTLNMDVIDLKIKVMQGGEDPDNLGETGLIYRKFYYVIESIEKAMKKIYELRKKLDSTKNDVETERPTTVEEDARLAKRLDDLKKRLGTAYQEATNEKNAQIQSQVNSQATVKVTPAPIPVKDEEERQALIGKYRNALGICVADGNKELVEIKNRLNTDATGIFPDKNYNPMQDRDVDYVAWPLPQALSNKDIAQMAPEMLTQEINFNQTLVDVNKKLKAVVDKYPGQYEGFASDYMRKITPIMSALAGLGADYQSAGADAPLREATAQSILLSMIVKRLPQESAIYEINIEGMKAQFSLLAGRASAFAAKFTTEAANILNACTFAITKGKAAIQNAESTFKSGSEANKYLNKIRAEVAQMYAGGADGAKVKEYLEKEKELFFRIYEPAAQVGHLRALALNTRFQSEEKLRSDPDYFLMKRFSEFYPEKGIKDAEQAYGQELWDVDMNGNPMIREGVFDKCGEIENWSYEYADQIREFTSFTGKIDEINQKVRNLFADNDYSTANSKITEVMSVLDPERDTLNQWLKSYGSVDGKTPGRYDIFSLETRNVIAAAAKKIEDQANAENKTKQEEEKKRLDEERKKREREEAEQTGYRITNVRINTLAVPNTPGEMILLPADLRDGSVTLTAILMNIYGIQTILVSEDGRVFKEMPAGREIIYSFQPLPDRSYEPVVKLKMEMREDKVIPFFDRGQILVYKNIDYKKLVAEAVKGVADAYEAANVARFSELISKDFLGNRTFLEEGVRFDFDMFMDIRLEIFINRIERRAGVYVCETKWNKTQVVRKTGQQQRTSGQTTFIFVLEDWKMKIQNLRGNLIYATLSPEIAESSGLNQTIVEQIRAAEQERNPIQPGAGQTQESGVQDSSAPLSVRSGQVHATVVPFARFSYDLASGNEGALGAGDFDYEGNGIFLNGACKMKNVTGQSTFEALSEAPADDGSYSTGMINPLGAGDVYVFITNAGYFGKMKLTSNDSLSDPQIMQFQYAVQTDRTRNIRT